MNRHLHSPTKLTEFAREFDEEPETLFTKFVNKLTNAYNTSYNTVNDLQTAGVSNLPSSSSLGNITPIENVISRASSVSSTSSSNPNPANTDLSSTTSANDDPLENSEKVFICLIQKLYYVIYKTLTIRII